MLADAEVAASIAWPAEVDVAKPMGEVPTRVEATHYVSVVALERIELSGGKNPSDLQSEAAP